MNQFDVYKARIDAQIALCVIQVEALRYRMLLGKAIIDANARRLQEEAEKFYYFPLH